jgi:hypothetical protein
MILDWGCSASWVMGGGGKRRGRREGQQGLDFITICLLGKILVWNLDSGQGQGDGHYL